MNNRKFPTLDIDSALNTRDALHTYSRVLGDCLKFSRLKRKHWWHASLRPSLSGITTGVIHAHVDFELEIDFRHSQLNIQTVAGEVHTELLQGQPVYQLVDVISDFMVSSTINRSPKDHINLDIESTRRFDEYSTEQAFLLGQVLSDVAATMTLFRAQIREETSPIQLWPHHFDLSMLWLLGETVPGQDPEDEESADKQMNFGFTFGDENIPEPYFYVTAYPLPDTLPTLELPAGTQWNSEEFIGAVLPYRVLSENPDPQRYLLQLWTDLLSAGRQGMQHNPHQGC